jgi:hypothetical protein
MEQHEEVENDGHDGTGRWPGGARPTRSRRRKVAGTIIWATDIEEEKRRRTEGEGRVPLLQPVSSHAAR